MIFPVKYPKKIIFTKDIKVKTSELPRWKPKTIIGRGFERGSKEEQ